MPTVKVLNDIRSLISVTVIDLHKFLTNSRFLSSSKETIILLSCRYRLYKKEHNHYFTKLLLFLYLWLPSWDSFRGALFPIVFVFSHGPLLWSVVLWRNSIVPHSTDKMTNVFVHVSPAVTLWGNRW